MAKQIVGFVSDEEKMNERLSELKTWLLSCSYRLAIIEKVFFNAKLQGLAPKIEVIVIPFVSTHYSNFDSKSISITANSQLKLVSAIFYQIFIFSPNDSPLKTVKNIFFISSKKLFSFSRYSNLWFFTFPSTLSRFKRKNRSGIIYDVMIWLA